MSENTSFWSYFWNSNDNKGKIQDTQCLQETARNSVSTPETNDCNTETTSIPVKRKAVQTNSPRLVVLRHKPSTTSLASMTAGKWLGWNPRKEAVQLAEDDEAIDDQEDETNEEYPEDEELENDDTLPDDNGDEVSDHVSKKRTGSWAFW